jgi:predicted porin
LFASAATSRFGVKGTRDLGDGVKGRVQFELQIEPDNSALIKTTANRTGFVALSKEGAGEIQLGTQETTAYEVFGMDVNGRVEYKPQVWRTTASSSLQDRANNALKYVSPKISGFEFHYQRGLSDTTQSVTGASATLQNSLFTSAGLKYHQDKFRAAIVADVITNQRASYAFAGIINAGPSNEGKSNMATNQYATALVYGGGTGLTNDDKVYRKIAAATYDFGQFSLNYIFSNSYTKGVDAGRLETNTLGVKVPFDKITVALSVGSGTVDSSTAYSSGYSGDGRIADTTAGFYYAIDKSTNAYILMSSSSFTGGYSGSIGKNNTYAIGARYNF